MRKLLLRIALYRNTDFGYKFVRVVCDTVVDQRDFTGKAGNLHFVHGNIVQQLPVLLRCFGMLPVKADPHSQRFRQCECAAAIEILLLQHEEDSIVRSNLMTQ